MAKSVLLSSVNRSESYPKMFSISAPYCCGTISIKKDESYTEQMLAELPSITFSVYTLQDDQYVLYKPRALSISVPKDSNPVSLAIIDIPTDCVLAVVPEFDNYALLSHNEGVEISGGDIWAVPTTEFPIEVTWDNTNIVADSGGSSPVDTYTKEEIDAMLEQIDEDKADKTYVDTHFVAGTNIEFADNPDGTVTINASGEISSKDDVARAGVTALEEQMLTKPTIYSNTTDYWNSQSTLISEENAIYVYTDYSKDEHDQDVPAIKIGDGSTFVVALRFVAGSDTTITPAEIDSWNNKVTASISELDNENLILSKT